MPVSKLLRYGGGRIWGEYFLGFFFNILFLSLFLVAFCCHCCCFVCWCFMGFLERVFFFLFSYENISDTNKRINKVCRQIKRYIYLVDCAFYIIKFKFWSNPKRSFLSAHCAVRRWIDSYWWTHGVMSCPNQWSTTGVKTKQRTWSVLYCVLHCAYKRSLVMKYRAGFPLWLSECSIKICLTPYNCK